MEIYFEEVFKYIQPGLLGKIELKAYSDQRISDVNAVSDFSEQEELECYQFTMHFKGFKQTEKTKKTPADNWVMSCGVENSGILFKKKIKADFYLINLFNQLIKEIMGRDTGYQYIVQSLNIQMLISLLRIIKNNLTEGKGEKYYHKIQAEKALNYLSGHYREDFFESDIVRDYNYSHYHRTGRSTGKVETETMKIIKNIKVRKDRDLFMYSNTLNRELLFEIKFKNNSYIILSTCEIKDSM